MFIWHGSLLSLLLTAGGCLDPIVLGRIVCDDEVDLHSVLKSDANSSSPLRNCHQRANLFPCVLTEDEQLHLQKQFGRVSKLSAQPEVSFTVCVHVQKLCILKVSAFPFPSVSMWSGSCERMDMYRTTSHYHNSFFFLVALRLRGFSASEIRSVFRENGWGIDPDPFLPCTISGPVHHCKRVFKVPPFSSGGTLQGPVYGSAWCQSGFLFK